MPDASRHIVEGELARLRAGLTLEVVAARICKSAGHVRNCELRGCCYGTARALATITGARMEAYLKPRMIDVPNPEYLALRRAASENERLTLKPKSTKGKTRHSPVKRRRVQVHLTNAT